MTAPAAVSRRPPECPQCGIKHERTDPHDPEAGRYQKTFHAEHGRAPTWRDALAHCPRQVREVWEETLRLNGEPLG